MATRIKVTGEYVDKSMYVLKKDNGDIFMTIREKIPFSIGNERNKWIPFRVPNKKRKGTILVCRKYDKYGKIIDSFPLIHKKLGLWALNAETSRKGVFHVYKGEI